jgi:hypothetical protein
MSKSLKSRSESSRGQAGRPLLLTDEVQERIVSALRAGAYIETAAAYSGIARPTLYLWIKKGRADPRGRYGVFVDAVDRAIADSEVRDLALITRAATNQWQAAAWKLERRSPDRWGRRDAKQITLTVEKELDSALDKLQGRLAPEEFERVVSIIAAEEAGSEAPECASGDPEE